MGLRPSGICSSHETFHNSSLRKCPLDVLPAGCAAPVLGRNAFGHVVCYLGCNQNHIFYHLQGFRPRENQCIIKQHLEI
jgi:hypothetical protein